MVTPDYNKVNETTNRDSSVTPTDDKTRRRPPVGDFNKVVEEVDEREASGDDSLDLLSKPKKKTGTARTSQKGEETLPQGPFGLARGYRDAADEQEKEQESTINPLATTTTTPSTTTVKYNPEEMPFDPVKRTEKPLERLGDKTAEYHHPLLRTFTEKSDERTARFGSVEQPDLASVSPYPLTPPHLVHATVGTLAASKAEGTAIPHSIQEVIDQIVSKVLILKENGQTETVVELEGTFKGSRLIVTQTDSAKGQINITIDNLSTENQRILETNRLSLVNDLLEKNGIQVNIFTASAIKENTGVDVATNDQEQQSFRNPDENPRRDGRRQKSNDQT